MRRRVRFAILRAMATPQPSKVLYLRGIPLDLSKKLKAAAALSGQSLQAYITQLLKTHVVDLERKGHLPKGKS